jgi:hypothetical protein
MFNRNLIGRNFCRSGRTWTRPPSGIKGKAIFGPVHHARSRAARRQAGYGAMGPRGLAAEAVGFLKLKRTRVPKPTFDWPSALPWARALEDGSESLVAPISSEQLSPCPRTLH